MTHPLHLVRAILTEPRLRGCDPDSDEFLALHRQILAEKPLMRSVFAEFYQACIDADHAHFAGDGVRLEVGAGVSFFKDAHPGVISTDIKYATHLDMVVDALALPFADASVRAVYGINCFHHLPDPARFFDELTRALAPGGGCVLIEPFHGPVASRFYRHVFASEGFDKSQPGWSDTSLGVMQGANQALSYIVFERDRRRFEVTHPTLELVLTRPLPSYARYLLSGGLNFRSLVPHQLAPLLARLEGALTPVNRVFALHHLIVIRKRPAAVQT